MHDRYHLKTIVFTEQKFIKCIGNLKQSKTTYLHLKVYPHERIRLAEPVSVSYLLVTVLGTRACYGHLC